MAVMWQLVKYNRATSLHPFLNTALVLSKCLINIVLFCKGVKVWRSQVLSTFFPFVYEGGSKIWELSDKY